MTTLRSLREDPPEHVRPAAALADAGAASYLGPAEVLATRCDGVSVRLADGVEVEARLALPVRYVPEPGDSLLVLGGARGHYVVGVLEGTGRTVLDLPGAVDLRAVGGDLTLASDRAVRLDAPEIVVRTTTLRTFAETALEQLGVLRQRVRDLVDLHAGRAQTVVDGDARTQARSSTLLTQDRVTINGRAVHLG